MTSMAASLYTSGQTQHGKVPSPSGSQSSSLAGAFRSHLSTFPDPPQVSAQPVAAQGIRCPSDYWLLRHASSCGSSTPESSPREAQPGDLLDHCNVQTCCLTPPHRRSPRIRGTGTRSLPAASAADQLLAQSCRAQSVPIIAARRRAEKVHQ
jgi:hypothetical protein